MSGDIPVGEGADTAGSRHRRLTLAGALMLGGFLLNVVLTAGLHPSGEEDDHPAIFTQYAESSSWIAVHLGQFIAVLVTLSGLLVLYRVLRGTERSSLVAQLAAAAVVATAAIWAVLQGLDGVGLKQAVDSWAGASGTEKTIRFANAETVRWLEWGFQSYFRILLGLSLALFGTAILAGRQIPGWLGWTALAAGLCSVIFGIDVGYSGLAGGLQDVLGIATFVLVLVFAIGVLVAGVRERGHHS
ncbi:hypothetical protein [Streptomyces xantholiticus]|uniref:hypothetical protein n=1 Tax=Streptomyces xantholiticus TaxID=68285 RepID=UPI0016746106|nr:hypothetical protein [Streptomyces xantholiticus]GGW49468.1 hypothetical protein GCM10010381_38520 [Streptomyces xantholiticus]